MPGIVPVLSGLLGWLVYWLVRLEGFDLIAAQFKTAARAGRAKVYLEAAARTAGRSVAEPRDGALVLIVKLGSVDNVNVPGAEAIIENAARDTFGNGNKVFEHRTFAEYVARNTPSFSVLFREPAPLVRQEAVNRREARSSRSPARCAMAAGGMTSVREEMITKVRTRLLPEKRTRASKPPDKAHKFA